MVLKAMKNCLKKKLSGKTFVPKNIFGKFFGSLEIFQSSKVWKCSEVHVKNNFAF